MLGMEKLWLRIPCLRIADPLVAFSKFVPISADSSDKYTSDRRGSVEMVQDLFEKGWEISKVFKTQSVMYWISSMKEYKIHIVKNHLYQKAIREKENYRFKEVNGIAINQPHDSYNHFWDAGRYAHMSYELDNLTVDSN